MTDITLPRAELEQVLEALEKVCVMLDNQYNVLPNGEAHEDVSVAVTALRERLAQPEQEPDGLSWLKKPGYYFSQPRRKPLTKDEIRDGARKTDPAGEDLCSWSFECGVRFAEDAHGIKGGA